MTAEIAILNKLAVALATDSAVTISAGRQEQKIYDSADKLFDLSARNPIGIMIYNGMQFMQAPLQVLIAEYRLRCHAFETVRDAADDFLKYLNDWGAASPAPVIRRAVEQIIISGLDAVSERIARKNEELVPGNDVQEFLNRFKAIPGEVISVISHAVQKAEESQFVGGKKFRLTKDRVAMIREIIEENWRGDNDQIQALIELSKHLLLRNISSAGTQAL